MSIFDRFIPARIAEKESKKNFNDYSDAYYKGLELEKTQPFGSGPQEREHKNDETALVALLIQARENPHPQILDEICRLIMTWQPLPLTGSEFSGWKSPEELKAAKEKEIEGCCKIAGLNNLERHQIQVALENYLKKPRS